MPSSSAHCATGSTTSAERGRLGQERGRHTTRKSSAPSLRSIRRGRGADTTTLLPITSSARGPVRRPERVEQLERRPSRPGKPRRVDAPYRRDMLAGGRVVDAAIAGQLIGLLAVLAAALAVALTGQAAVPAAARYPAGPARAPG